MNNLNFVRGLFLMGIAAVFGMFSLNYQIGQFSHSGPGLFPLMVSGLLFLVGLFTIVRARFVEPVAVSYNVKNIVIILVGLCGFVLVTKLINMTVGILFLVFFTSLAGSSFSAVRSLKISAVLIAIALMFKHLLGLNLPLF